MKKWIVFILPLLICTSALASEKEFKRGLAVYQQKNYTGASRAFYYLARNSKDANVRIKSKLYLGISLYRLGVHQVASFPLVEVVRQGQPAQRKMAIDYLVAVANKLNEASLLNYAMKRASNSEMSETAKGVLEFRRAESLADQQQYDKAINLYEQALSSSSDTQAVLYSLGLTYLQMKQPAQAISYFEKLTQSLAKSPPTSVKKGTAVMGLARAYYQNKNWEEAIELYRQIPKDNPVYRQSLLEISWALFRSGQFRSAMSPLQTLHSPFYQNFYDPESLVLRGVILLFICKFDEIEKILQTYDYVYKPGLVSLDAFLGLDPSPDQVFAEVNKAYQDLHRVRKGDELQSTSRLPFFISRSLLEEQDVKRMVEYLDKLKKEKTILDKVAAGKGGGGLKAYGTKILASRQKFAQNKIGRMSLAHLKFRQAEIADMGMQMDFLKYEMLNGQREALRRKMSKTQLQTEDKELSRNYYVQNGYRYWPFQGEYWRDEIGNYQYVGVNSCE